jgi:hypothetical protein
MNAGQDGRDGTSRTVGGTQKRPTTIASASNRRDEEIAQRGDCVDGLYPRGKGRTVG